MSKSASNDTLTAMHDADRHAAGDTKAHNSAHPGEEHVHEHTKPAGDLRALEQREEGHQKARSFTVGHGEKK